MRIVLRSYDKRCQTCARRAETIPTGSLDCMDMSKFSESRTQDQESPHDRVSADQTQVLICSQTAEIDAVDSDLHSFLNKALKTRPSIAEEIQQEA